MGMGRRERGGKEDDGRFACFPFFDFDLLFTVRHNNNREEIEMMMKDDG